MWTFFFVSGYLAPSSLKKQGSWGFLKGKLRRLMLPWAIAVFTLIPLYNMIFLVSRGLPQEGWSHYFHFTNDHISMSWLWFLPVLFLFNVLYVLLRKLNLPAHKLALGQAVALVFVLSVVNCEILSELGWLGWTKTALIDFQNERLLPYFLVFLLGSFCYRNGILETERKGKKLYVAINATSWIPINVYIIVLLNFFLRPGQFIVSAAIDGFILWVSLYTSMLGLLYCVVTTFKIYFNRRGRLARVLRKLSYNVYIIHVAVMGPIALLLLDTDFPALVKYPILAVATYGASNLLAWAYARMVDRRNVERAVAAPRSPQAAS